ncbi:MAG: preprotein translocase subunit YajC [Burkholderiales bacterium]|nr:MAG: preprotein translocase subunit YajC [Burkholderiales bacterium]
MLISPAYAQAASGGESQLLGLMPIVLMFVVLYFLMIRPQMKRAKEHKQMVEALQKGDEVIAAGGMVGRINKVAETYVTLEIARAGEEGIEVNVQRSAVQALLPKGTIKSI